MIEMMNIYSSIGETDEVEKPVASGDSMTDETADPAEQTAGEVTEQEESSEEASTEEESAEEASTEEASAEEASTEDQSPEEESAEEASAEEASTEEESVEEEPREEPEETPDAEPVEEAPVSPKTSRIKKVPAGELAYEWYVIKVANGREDTLSRKVEKTLSLRGLDHHVRKIEVPKQKVTEIKDGKKRVREHKLYQGYFFMECQLVDEIWYLLRDIQGVGSFVGGKPSDKPMPMLPDEVRKLRDMMEQRESEAPPELKIDVKKNDTVKVKDGPFENFEGIVDEVHPKTGKLRVLVTIFGRETPVDLEYWQVEQT